jgi:uncharacterized membrane protein YheB (UPF0754 family)
MLIFSIPFISALIGWFTNWIAIKMLFRPQHPKKILFMTVQGIFPKNQKYVAEKLGHLIATELFSSSDIRYRMTHNTDVVKKVIEEKIDYYLENTFAQNYPIVSVFFSTKRKAKIKVDLVAEVERAAPDVIDQYLASIEEEINVAEIVKEKIELLPAPRLEELIMSVLGKEFRFIEGIGAVIGFIIGMFQVGIFYLQ